MIKSITAGICIGLGGLCYLSVENKTVGAFLFSIGLFSVLIFKLNLYTGLVCKPEIYKKKPLLLIESLAGNFVGAVYIGLLLYGNRLAVQELCQVKMEKPFSEWFVMSVICGMFIALAVYGWNEKSNIMVVLGVMGFILSGAEHVVADAFYFAAAGRISEPEILIRLLECALGNLTGGLTIGGFIIVSRHDT